MPLHPSQIIPHTLPTTHHPHGKRNIRILRIIRPPVIRGGLDLRGREHYLHINRPTGHEAITSKRLRDRTKSRFLTTNSIEFADNIRVVHAAVHNRINRFFQRLPIPRFPRITIRATRIIRNNKISVRVKMFYHALDVFLAQ